MKHFALIGFPLGHSLSAKYFAEKFSAEGIDADYTPLSIESAEEVLPHCKHLAGFNVTIPHKQAIMPLLAAISEEAQEIGAVNCVKVTPDGLEGYNTDVIGIRKSLEGVVLGGAKALVLGTGGASKAVQYVLRKNNIPFKVVSRNLLGIRNEELGIIDYDDVDATGFSPYTLLINTTPVGMFPNVNECLELPYSTIAPHNIFIDLIYNPDETLFLKKARLKGASTYNGLTMLYEQAEAAWNIWEN